MTKANPQLSPGPGRIPSLEPVTAEKVYSLWGDAWRRLLRNRAAVGGLCFFVFILLFSLVGPWLTPYSFHDQERSVSNSRPMELILREVRYGPEGTVSRDQFSGLFLAQQWIRLNHPEADVEEFLQRIQDGESVRLGDREYSRTSRKHLLGTDHLGRDLLTRIMHGGRISLAVGFLATLVSVCIGVLYGALSGYVGGRLDAVMMRFVDILYAMPFTIFVILLMTFFGRHLWLMFLAIGAVEWLTMARIVRGQVVSLKKQEFVEAALALGQKQRTIITRHIIPNVLGPVIVYATLTIPAVILLESFLSFLGLGVQPPMASWGVLIDEGRKSMENYPWQLIFPAILFSATLLSMNFLGDGLRDALDPKDSR